MINEVQSKTQRLAVLIDADNASASLIEPLLKEIAKYGTAHVRRIYGDWTNSQLTKWKDKLNKFAIQPIQQFGYTTGKNATDSALIIDAMDLLYAGNFDGFCIVSSDSDFTRLASRIRESGLVVYGFGDKRKTPQAFVSACDKFIYTDILGQPESDDSVVATDGLVIEKVKSPKSITTKTSAKEAQELRKDQELVKLLNDAYEAVADEDEWAHLGPFGAQLNKLSSSFDPRNYGFKKLSDLVQAIAIFEVQKTSQTIHIKLITKSP
ncbi:MAG: NYN domain-containing protein [Leptolyngbyaceae cyanobacterium SL_7_1]|nr:NYN domain-containing protein [Leptolyngbyaceae cyanobacterium SL_7_1]